MRALSEDLRERIVGARAAGGSSAEVAERFGVSARSVDRFWQRQRERGHCRVGQLGGYRRSRLEGHEETVAQWITEKNDLSLEAICKRLEDQLGIKLGVSALWYRLEAMGLTYKKRRFARPNKIGPT